MARFYSTLAPARFQIREGVRGNWYVIDTDPGTYSRIEGSRFMVKDDYRLIFKGRGPGGYWRTYNGARNHAARLNAAG